MNIESFELLDGATEDLRSSQLLMVGSQLAGDPKMDHCDRGDPRWTPTLHEAWVAVQARKELEKEHAFLLALLVDIKREIDHGDIDLQQTAVAIKRLRDILGTETIMKAGIKPGLVRK